MFEVKVLGTGCANCKATQKIIEDVASENGTPINVEKVEDVAKIMSYGIMSTPGVVINEKVVHAGGIPDRGTVEGWLKGDTGCCSGNSSDTAEGSCCG